MDRAKLKLLLEQHHADAYTWALHCCRGNQDEAKDVLQNTYLTVLEQTAPFAGRSSFKTWLFVLIRRKAQGARRTLLRRIQLLYRDYSQPGAIRPLGEEQVYRSELQQQVTALLSRLSARQREVLYLVFYHELTLEEAAQVMSLSLGSARTHYQRGKQRLREQIEEAGLKYELAVGR